jgi:hypothetical protein
LEATDWKLDAISLAWRWLGNNLNPIESIFYALSTIGVLCGVYLFFRKVRQESQQNNYIKYSALQRQYMRFQELCIQYPRLDFGPWPPEAYGICFTGERADLTAEEKYQQDQMFWLLISIFEEFYLLRNSMADWHGWEEYIVLYCKVQRFRDIWYWEGGEKANTSNMFDRNFERYLNLMLEKHRPSEQNSNAPQPEVDSANWTGR